MITVFIVIGFSNFGFILGTYLYSDKSLSCGLDNSKTSVLYEGIADIHIYPWMGILYYPFGKKKLSTSVVLVTKQIVIGAADEIDSLPKEDLRARSRVVLGHNCSGSTIRVRDYVFHPDYKRRSYTALALVQLDIDALKQELRPICPPPPYFAEPNIYAIANGECKKGRVRVFKMEYVSDVQCKQFYRKSGLGLQKFWPIHSACARTHSEGTCRWRSGTALVIKQDGRWRLLGYGVNGPGCHAPSRFLDYGMHQQWVRRSVARIGKPAITRMADNHIIMRRTLSNLQRYGDCDREETRYVMYSDSIELVGDGSAKATYNLTLFANVEYSCIILSADIPADSANGLSDSVGTKQPKIQLKRWCAGTPQMCYGSQYIEINLYVLIEFSYRSVFKMIAYGKEGKIIDPQKGMLFSNKFAETVPVTVISHFSVILNMKQYQYNNTFHRWFYEDDVV